MAGVELVTSRSQVGRPNDYTEPPNPTISRTEVKPATPDKFTLVLLLTRSITTYYI